MTVKYLVLCCLLWCTACSFDNDQPSTHETWPVPAPSADRRIAHLLPAYSVDRADSSCRAKLRQARRDAQRGRLTYVLINSGKARYAHELKALLKKYQIGFIYEPMNCTGDYECYGYYMDSVIVRKYGRGFTNRLKHTADSLFVAQWPRKIYWLWDVDQAPACAVPDLHAYVTTRLQRPPGWDASPKKGPYFSSEREYVTAEFIVDTTGALSDIVLQADSENLKASNHRHRPYLQREIRRLVQATGPWQPGQLAGHKVSCRCFVDVTLNPELN